MNILIKEQRPNVLRPARIGVAALVAMAAFTAVTISSAHAAGGGMTVTKDPVTGELRLPTAAEHAALERVKAKAAASAAKEKLSNGKQAAVSGKRADLVNPETVYPDGSVSYQLDEESMVYSVVKRNADGSLSMECVTGSKSANKFLKAKQPVSNKTSSSDKGHSHELK